MAVTLYFTEDVTESAGISGTSQTATIPAPDLTAGIVRDLSETKQGLGTSTSRQSPLINSLAQTAVQRLLFGKWVSPPLTGITTLSANTWTIGYVGREGSLNSNMFPMVAIYVRKADGTVRGYVSDVDAGQDAELGNSTPPLAQIYTLSGSAVSGIVSTDRLVVEVFTRGAQSSATSYATRGFNYNGIVDLVDGVDGGADEATYVSTPQDGLFDASSPPPAVTGTTKLYLRQTQTESTGYSTAEKSASMSATAQLAQAHDMLEAISTTSPGQSDGIDSVGSTLSRYYFGKWISQPLVGLASTTLAADDWEIGTAGNVVADINCFFSACIYILKSDDTVRGYVWDSDTNLSNELGTATRGRVFTVAGSAVASIAATDRICLEIWARATPAGGGERIRHRFDGITEPVEGVNTSDVASYLLVPASAMFGSSVTLTHAGTITPAGTHTLVAGASMTDTGTITPTGSHTLTALADNLPQASGLITPAGVHSLSATGHGQIDTDPCNPGDVQWYLTVDGREVSNLARTYEYLSRFGMREIETICQPNGILYRVAGADEDNVPFTTPGDDPAPWYDPSRPESAEFYGFVGKPLVGPALSRAVTRRAFGGASLGPMRQTERVVTVDGFLFGSSSRGLDYGLRYLTDLLAGQDDCLVYEVEVRTAAPQSDGSDDSVGFWRLYNAGLDDPGVEQGERYGSEAEAVKFKLVAGDGYLYKDPELVVPLEPIPDLPVSGCVGISEWLCDAPTSSFVEAQVFPPVQGVLGTILTIDCTDSSINGVRIDVMLDCVGDEIVNTLRTEAIPVGTVLVIDSAREQVTWIDTDGVAYDGSMFIHLEETETIPWLLVRSTDATTCLRVGRDRWCSVGTGQVRIALQTQERRR